MNSTHRPLLIGSSGSLLNGSSIQERFPFSCADLFARETPDGCEKPRGLKPAARHTRAAAVNVLLACIAILPGPTLAYAQQANTDSANANTKVESLNTLLSPIRDKYHLPALVAAVVDGSKLVALGAVGTRHVRTDEPVQPTDQFHIGSCTKSMTATLCAMLIEDGKLSWSTTIGETFPKLMDKVRKEYRDVTLEQLLCHRSGLPEDRAVNALLFKLRTLKGDIRDQRRQMVELMLQQEPTAKPGEKFQYSNGGYAIVGAMAEAVTGVSWEQLISKRLFEPLGMNSAGFGSPGHAKAKPPDQPWGHRSIGKKSYPIIPGKLADNPAVLGPGATVHLSLPDWAKYAAWHLAPKQVNDTLLGERFVKKLHTDIFNQEYAFGWAISKTNKTGGLILEHSGSNSFWFAAIHLDIQRGQGILLATNQSNEDAIAALHTALKSISEHDNHMNYRHGGKPKSDDTP